MALNGPKKNTCDSCKLKQDYSLVMRTHLMIGGQTGERKVEKVVGSRCGVLVLCYSRVATAEVSGWQAGEVGVFGKRRSATRRDTKHSIRNLQETRYMRLVISLSIFSLSTSLPRLPPSDISLSAGEERATQLFVSHWIPQNLLSFLALIYPGLEWDQYSEERLCVVCQMETLGYTERGL